MDELDTARTITEIRSRLLEVGRIDVEANQSAALIQAVREESRVTAKPDGRVDNRVARLNGQKFTHLTRQDRRVSIRLVYHWTDPQCQSARGRSHLRGNTRSPDAAFVFKRAVRRNESRQTNVGKTSVAFAQRVDTVFELRDFLYR